jgi:CDP-diacylglycerol--glycerol-3-phosphate 3-phosphatidyltransferase
MNLPNKLTLSRIIVVPILMIFMIPIPESIINAGILEFMRPLMLSINDLISSYGGYIAAGIFIIA